MAPMEPSRAAPLPPSTVAAGPVIGKEDDETEGYGAACSVGVLNPLKNRNCTDWQQQPPGVECQRQSTPTLSTVGGNPEEPRATCNYCKKPYKCHSRKNGTSTLWGHVNKCKKNPKNKNNDKSQPTIVYHYKKAAVEGENDTKEIEVHQFSIKKIRFALARMIIVDELPFRFVEHEGFIYYMNVVEPRFPIPSRVTVAKDCMKLYLDERKKLKDVLSMKGQKGETIGKVVEKCLREWGIDIVLTITVDNASSNDVAIDYLRRKMKLKESCIVGCGISTYLMLEVAEKFERAFDRLIIDDEQYMDYFEEPDGNGKKPKGMKMKYEKYWGNIEKMNLLLFVAVVLDPRYKMKYIVYWFNKWYAKPKAESMVDRLYAHYATEFETASSSASGSINCVTSDVASNSMSSASDKHDPWKSAVEEFQHHLAQEDNGECKTEVDQYLSEASEPPCALGFDILGWWRVNSSKYKLLSHIARDVMAVPVSAVASELAFSIGGRVLDSFRSSLSPLTVKALICCQNWLRSTSSPVKLREAMDEVQSIDEELESVGSLGVGD
uniref:BED-type domain-containing protein n=1 Tax=Fagus sylvatica TaxID=28930 RepID=A0A2N9IQB5_FAGSY